MEYFPWVFLFVVLKPVGFPEGFLCTTFHRKLCIYSNILPRILHFFIWCNETNFRANKSCGSFSSSSIIFYLENKFHRWHRFMFYFQSCTPSPLTARASKHLWAPILPQSSNPRTTQNWNQQSIHTAFSHASWLSQVPQERNTYNHDGYTPISPRWTI
jgi:hypothetical protein